MPELVATAMSSDVQPVPPPLDQSNVLEDNVSPNTESVDALNLRVSVLEAELAEQEAKVVRYRDSSYVAIAMYLTMGLLLMAFIEFVLHEKLPRLSFAGGMVVLTPFYLLLLWAALEPILKRRCISS